MATARAPKQWQLTTNETITSFENWKQNLVYILSLDHNFALFLEDGYMWQKKSATNPNRGLQSDGEDVPRAIRRTAAQKNAQLELMLGQIANYCSVISRNSIIKGSTSLADIWQKIRQHFGFQSTGAHFLDLTNIALKPAERPEDLFQRLTAFIEDNLLTADGGITHHGEQIAADEDLTPSMENIIVVLWLQLINPGLPQLVKQKYGSELRNRSLASLKPEISQALSSLLDELRSIEDTKVLRTASFNTSGRRFLPQSRTPNTGNRPRQFRCCVLCKSAGRASYSSHNLVDCKFLPASDRLSIGRSRMVADDDLDIPQEEYSTPCDDDITRPDDSAGALIDQPTVLRVDVIQSPILYAHYLTHPVRLTLDTGATTNMITAAFANSINLPTKPATQSARQADGVTPLDVIGETHCTLTRGSHTFQLDALVVKDLDVDVIAGIPFMSVNDIATRPAKRQIVLGGSEVIQYGSKVNRNASIRRAQAFLLRGPSEQTVVLPGEFVELSTPKDTDADTKWALEPRFDSPSNLITKPESAWPPVQEITSVDHILRVPNNSEEPIILRRNEHLCQIRAISSVPDACDSYQPAMPTPPPTKPSAPFSSGIHLDPDNCLSQEARDKFEALHRQYDDVFNPAISKYNGASGNIEAVVNMGPTLPPQRKGRLPHYNRESLLDLQSKFDELEAAGVFAKPEDVNATVEYLNLSFLVRKPKGGFRLVTSFGEVARYSKPPPSLMPNVDSVLRDIGKWKFIIVSDLLKAFYQIPLAKSSMKYCGVATPFKGIRVYTRCAMGMPGSETCLEELLCRVLGHLIEEGLVIKLADDLFCGGNTPDEAALNWQLVLDALQKNNLRLTASKTVICPRSTTILGWIWSNGTLTASPHRIAALSSTEPPLTVQGLRSFIGAYKVLSRVLHGYAELLHPLDKVVAGKQSKDKITWSDDLSLSFRTAQAALKDCRAIHIPRPDDCLWIVTDASIKNRGMAATLYTLRQDKLLLAGFFNAKLKKHQVTWLPCELEALAIGAAVKHFAPFIIQANTSTQVLTDSRPCVQAYDKLRRGEFSASSRVTTFLATVSRYPVQVRHISGAANLPSDYASRNPSQCSDQSCQICRFIHQTADSVIRSLSVNDVVAHGFRMPFTSHAAWQDTQRECPDLRRTHSHLTQGTRPQKKITNIPDVKRYLKEVSISNDGLLVVRGDRPFQRACDRIVVPRGVIDGLLTAIHIRFDHPTHHQTHMVFNRYFFALDLDKSIDRVTTSCHHCMSLKSIPKHLYPQSTASPPERIGTYFAADVMRRYRQCVLVLRETTSSLTLTSLIDNERHECLRDSLLVLCSTVRSLGDGGIYIRVDPAPGFTALANDSMLKQHGINLVIGHAKNVNKNPIAERAIQELGLECLHLSPEGGPISSVTLALATANLNSRIRGSGLSAHEIWTQRDQVTGQQLPIDDTQIISQLHASRELNHPFSSKAKAHNKTSGPVCSLEVGHLVYLKADRDKTRVRDKYIVTSVSGEQCQVRKFTKTQFRSKCYDLRIQDCYPVMPTTIAPPAPGPIRGLEYHDKPNDRDRDPDPELCAPMPDERSTPPVKAPDPPGVDLPPPLPENIVMPLAPEVIPTIPDHIDPTDDPYIPDETLMDSNPVDPLAAPPRRSGRLRQPPTWQQSAVWDMN